MAKFQRETATQAADLPHQFDPVPGGIMCDVCVGAYTDPRHRAWEQQEVADRERASAGSQTLMRETGS